MLSSKRKRTAPGIIREKKTPNAYVNKRKRAKIEDMYDIRGVGIVPRVTQRPPKGDNRREFQIYVKYSFVHGPTPCECESDGGSCSRITLERGIAIADILIPQHLVQDDPVITVTLVYYPKNRSISVELEQMSEDVVPAKRFCFTDKPTQKERIVFMVFAMSPTKRIIHNSKFYQSRITTHRVLAQPMLHIACVQVCEALPNKDVVILAEVDLRNPELEA